MKDTKAWLARAKSVRWEDASSYSRDQRGNIVPTTWTCQLGEIRISVTRIHGLPGRWYLGLGGPLTLPRYELSPNLENAKIEALRRVRLALVTLIDALP